MAAQCGAGILVSIKDAGGTYRAVAGLRSTKIAFNSEAVDATNADSVGRWREILDGCGVRSMSVSGDGVFQDDTGVEAVRDMVFNNNNRDGRFFIPGFGTIDSKVKCTALESGGEYNGEVTYSMSFESAGAVTFTVS